MTSHERIWSSATPGLLIILLDQSGVMLDAYDGIDTKTTFASKNVNHILNYLIMTNFDGESPKNRCFISVIGYGNDVKELCSGYLKDLDANPIRIDSIKKKMSDGAGGIIEVPYNMPIWVEPISSTNKDEDSNMKKAFELALKTIRQWITRHLETPAPIVFNISNGMPHYDGKSIETCMAETSDVANQLKDTRCYDGNVLIYNVLMNGNDSNISFPYSIEQCSDNIEQYIFEISSGIPYSRQIVAQRYGIDIRGNARACVNGYNIRELVGLIQLEAHWGDNVNYCDKAPFVTTRNESNTENDSILDRIWKLLNVLFSNNTKSL